jgi:hypothetical protein
VEGRKLYGIFQGTTSSRLAPPFDLVLEKSGEQGGGQGEEKREGKKGESHGGKVEPPWRSNERIEKNDQINQKKKKEKEKKTNKRWHPR